MSGSLCVWHCLKATGDLRCDGGAIVGVWVGVRWGGRGWARVVTQVHTTQVILLLDSGGW